MERVVRGIAGVSLLLLLTIGLVTGEEHPRQQSKRPAGLQGSPAATHMNINRISSGFYNFGRCDADTKSLMNPGGYYPKPPQGKTVFFTSGLIWGAHYGPGGEIRIGGGGRGELSGLQPGRILGNGQPEDPNLSKNRIYRVRPDIPPGNQTADVSSEFRDDEGTDAEIRAQYGRDWLDWPAADGAPFTYGPGRGAPQAYDPAKDIPGEPGADQTLWYVANDIVSSPPNDPYYRSMGIEMQQTAWAYAREGALGNMIFRRSLLINKGTMELDSMFVSLYADADIGYPADDLVGCDTARSLGFAYNAVEHDLGYTPLPPPAAGYDFFQGPKVLGAASDSAIFRRRRVYGMKNLPMTAFYGFFYSGDLPDPTDGPDGVLQWYNYMQGLIGWSGQAYVDPRGVPTRFPFAGDPVTRTGWLDDLPNDIRFGLCSGPFTMARGDTQEIVIAEIAAGADPGNDRLTAVALLKYYDDQGQAAYDNFFNVPVPPPAPHVTAGEFDREIVLNWGNDSAAVAATEQSDSLRYAFQGYNIYQLPSATATLGDARTRRLATFDIVDGVTKISDKYFDPATLSVASKVVQFGSDAGVARKMHIVSDAFNSDLPLVNGTKYYFAVTAYNYNWGGVPNNLESSPQIITVTPHSPNPGVRYQSKFGETLSVSHASGKADGIVAARIVDPSLIRGDEYEIRIGVTDSVALPFGDTTVRLPNPRWRLYNTTRNEFVTAPSTKFDSSGTDAIAEHCIQIGLAATPIWNPGKEIAAQTYDPPSGMNWTGVDAGLAVFGGGLDVAWNFLGGGTSTLRPFEVTKNVEVRFSSSAGQSAYDFKRTSTGGSFSAPYAGFYTQPFRVYDVTDTANPRQIDFVFMEMTGQPTENNVWAPGSVGADREYFWFIDEDYTPVAKAEYAGTTLGALLSSKPGLFGGWYVLKDSTKPAYKDGDVWRIKATHVVTAEDRWRFSTAGMGVVESPVIARQDVSNINVFPNPYYGVNPQETDRYLRFVTFSHLPQHAVIRIFNLAGVMVRKIDRSSPSQFEQWDLKNQDGLPVGSGLYIAHIDMPELGVSRILKIAVIQEQQILDRY